MNIILFFYMILSYFGYLAWTTNKYGLQKDISNTLYVLPDNYKFIFGLFCISYAVPALLIAHNWLITIAALGILSVSVAPIGNGSPSSLVHSISSATSFIASTLYILCVIPNGIYISLGILFCLLAVTFLDSLERTVGLWQEMIATIGMFIALGLIVF